jgi:hypothetical protein
MTTPLTPQAKLDAVRAKIVEANPEIVAGKARMILGYGRNLQPEVSVARPIRLADVLIALDTKSDEVYVGMDMQGWFSIAWRRQAQWNLRRDSLDDQSPETMYFLFSLLCE